MKKDPILSSLQPKWAGSVGCTAGMQSWWAAICKSGGPNLSPWLFFLTGLLLHGYRPAPGDGGLSPALSTCLQADGHLGTEAGGRLASHVALWGALLGTEDQARQQGSPLGAGLDENKAEAATDRQTDRQTEWEE